MTFPSESQKAELICLDAAVFRMMFNDLVDKIRKLNSVDHDPWISSAEAMNMLRISSPTTLKKFCDEGLIRSSALTPKLVLYHRESILAFIEKSENKTPHGKG